MGFRDKLNIKIVIGTIISIFLIVVPLAVITILSYQDSQISVQDVEITNVTDSAFTVTWVSNKKYIGEVYYQSEGKNWFPIFSQMGKEVAFDDRDVELNQEGEYVEVAEGAKERYTHHITIRNLMPEQGYSFRVGGAINGKQTSVDSVKTTALTEDISTPDPAYGEITGIDPSDTFVIAQYQENKVSAPVSTNSTYAFDMGYFKKNRLQGNDLTLTIKNFKKIFADIELTQEGYKPLEKIIISDSVEGQFYSPIIRQTLAANIAPGDFCYGDNTQGNSSNKFICSNTSKCIYAGIEDKKQLWSPYLCGAERACCRSIKDSTLLDVSTNAVNEGRDEGINQDLPANNKEDNTEVCSSLSSANFHTRKECSPDCSQENINKCSNMGATCFAGKNNDGGFFCTCNNDSNNYLSSGDLSQGKTLNCENTQVEVVDTKESQHIQLEETTQDPDVLFAQDVNMSNEVGATPPRTSLDIAVGVDSRRNYTTEEIKERWQEYWDFIVSFYGLESIVGGEIKLEFGYAGNTGICQAGPSLNCSIGTDQRGTRFIVNQKGMSYLFGVSAHEGSHYLQRRCNHNLHYNKSFRELAADKYAIDLSKNNAINNFVGDYAFDVEIWTNGQKIHSLDRARADTAAFFINSYLLDQFPGAPTIEDYMNCNYDGEPAQYRDAINLGSDIYGKPDKDYIYLYKHYLPDNSYVPTSGTSENAMHVDDNENRLTGLVTKINAQDSAIEVAESGSYSFFSQGQLLASEDIILRDNENKLMLKFFEDANGNGVKDDDEQYIENDVSIKKEKDLFTYKLTAGWNLIHFPLFVSLNNGTVARVSELIEEWNHYQDASIKQVARFRNGRFEVYKVPELGNDFSIAPGDGLFVYNVSGNVEVTVEGNSIKEAYPLIINNGWNLVGVISPDQSYSSEKLLSEMSTQGIEADTVSQFENGRYQSVVQDEGTLFGNNFNIVDKRGYFIRVESGGGKKFTP